MGKFDAEIAEKVAEMEKGRVYLPGRGYFPLRPLSFQWDTGYVVISEYIFNKLTPKQKDLLLAPMVGGKKNVHSKRKSNTRR